MHGIGDLEATETGITIMTENPRFKVVSYSDAAKFEDPNGYLLFQPLNFENFLVDTANNEIVWTDGYMQPEDATLNRDLKVLVDLLNRVAKELP